MNIYKFSYFINLLVLLMIAQLASGQVPVTSHYAKYLKSDLHKRNKAYRNSDLKSIYRYTHKSELKGMSLAEFKEESNISLNAMKEDNIRIDSFQVLRYSDIVRCDNIYQCLIRQSTFMQMPGKRFSFESNIVGFSENGSDWTFINGGTNTYEDLVKQHPEVCKELFVE